jgi:hypothetical protein
MVREGPAQPPPYPAEKAHSAVDRRTQAWRVILGGLIGVAVLVWMLMLLR